MVTPTPANAPGPLVSPPPIGRKGALDMDLTPDIVLNSTVTPERNLGDLLCTLNFDQVDINRKPGTSVKVSIPIEEANDEMTETVNIDSDMPQECTENIENTVTPHRS